MNKYIKRNVEMLKCRAGQLTIVGLLMIFLILVVLSILMNDILDTVSSMAANLTAANYPEVALLIQLVPLFIVAVLLATIALYGSPRL